MNRVLDGLADNLRILEHLLQVNLLLAVRACLLLAHYAPATNAELMKNMIAGQFVSILYDSFLVFTNYDVVPAHRAYITL